MTNVMDKLTEVLSNEAFYMENKDLEKPEEIIAAIQNEVPEATAEEIDELLTRVSEMVNRDDEELTMDDLEAVAGGFSITLTMATVGTVLKIAAGAGTVIGGVMWYWKHRKCI